MADDVARQYFEAWVTMGEVTRERAEEIVRQLVEAGDIQREHFEAWVERLLEQAEANARAVAEIVRTELGKQLASLGLVSRSDVARLEARLDDLTGRLSTVAAAPARRAKKTAEKARPKRAAAKKGAAKKGAAKKGAAKKGAAKRAGAKSTASKRAAAKRAATSTTKRGTRAKKTRR
jgi:polyhydroxyalkanoate synthesis regulator phasin